MKKYERFLDNMTKKKREEFATCLAALPPDYQIAIKGALAGTTQAEIAKELGVSRPRVAALIKRGLAAISENTK